MQLDPHTLHVATDPLRMKANSKGKTRSTRRRLRPRKSLPLPLMTQAEEGEVRAWRRARAEHRVCLVGQRRCLDGLAHPARYVSRTSGGIGSGDETSGRYVGGAGTD